MTVVVDASVAVRWLLDAADTDEAYRLLRGQEDRTLTKEVILEHLAMLLPNERPEKMFATMVNWGRFAELFGYNKDEDRFYLDQE